MAIVTRRGSAGCVGAGVSVEGDEPVAAASEDVADSDGEPGRDAFDVRSGVGGVGLSAGPPSPGRLQALSQHAMARTAAVRRRTAVRRRGSSNDPANALSSPRPRVATAGLSDQHATGRRRGRVGSERRRYGVGVRTRPAVRVLGPGDIADVRRLLDRDPVTHVFVDSRVRATRLEPRWLGGEIWGFQSGGELVSMCHAAANVVPVHGTPEALDAFAARAIAKGRTCGSILGPEPEVQHLWRLLRGEWGPARSVRPHQPFLVLDRLPRVTPAPEVRRVRPDELDALYPACVAMYTEELGVSPEAGNSGSMYRARVAQLISKGHAFAHVENGQVVFKAELGAVTPHAAQVQSVWVAPQHRGEGRAAAGVAAVCAAALRDCAPVVSLYVNEHNEAARRTYDRVGFVETGRFATILF